MEMRYFSRKVLGMGPSVIRELVKRYPGGGGIITLTSGRPHPSTFPVNVIKELVNEALDKHRDVVLQYGPTPGYPGLIDQVRALVERRYGINTSCAVLG